MQQTELLDAYLQAIRAMRGGDFGIRLPAILNSDAPLHRLGVELQQLAEWLDDRFRQIQQLQHISKMLNGSLFTHQVLERVYESFRDLIPYDRIGCALISDDCCSVEAWWARSDHPAGMRIKNGYRAELAGSSLDTILNSGAPRILNDLEAYLEAHPDSYSTRLIVDEGIRSSLTCPLIAEGKPVGFLFFSSRRKNSYDPEHQLIFQEIAGQLSVLIERSRFYQQIHDLNQHLLRTQQALREQALRDALTGLLNHGAILESLDEHLDYADRQSEPISILMADLDHFKQINDRYGHLAGDAALKVVAASLQGCLRGHDRLGRYGGEEFLMVLTGTPAEAAHQVAERIRAEVAAQQVIHGKNMLQLTISIGVATLEPGEADQPDKLLARADAALYQAKHDGRNRVRMAKTGVD